MSTEIPSKHTFINIQGRSHTLEISHQLRSLQIASDLSLANVRCPESSIDLVTVTLNKEDKSRQRRFVVKHSLSPSDQSVQKQLKKWLDLKEVGVSVIPTLRIDPNTQTMLATDLTQNGECELFDPVDLIRRQELAYLSGVSIPQVPEWVFRHKYEILDQIVNNNKKAALIRYEISPGAYFSVYHPVTDTVHVILGDFGRDVVCRSPDYNIVWESLIDEMNALKQFRVLDEVECDYVAYKYNYIRYVASFMLHRLF